MNRIHVKTIAPYDVVIGKNILEECFGEISSRIDGGNALVVTDDGVPFDIVLRVENGLKREGKAVFVHRFARGEVNKTPQTLLGIISFLAENRFDRNDGVIAVGGGVVGDVAGLAASLYMRGISYVQIPTTLLAAVDSSVGGKTAVDLPQGKNLMGAFYQPSLVVCDVLFLKTLSLEDVQCGVGECVKYGLIAGGNLWETLGCSFLDKSDKLLKTHENGDICELDLVNIISDCVQIKANVVAEDEREGGYRRVLNLGHSVGHAIEKLSGYTIPHGVCVAKGIVKILQMGVGKYNGADLVEKVISVFSNYGIDTVCPYSADELLDAMRSDKKSSGNGLSLVFVREVGDVIIERMSFDALGDLL
ncbi:MAG: 3-dehydroquinate synthase [Clostridia bacterium]|nr:3-dehydroquinate synthase [Clostridia bacterium]